VSGGWEGVVAVGIGLGGVGVRGVGGVGGVGWGRVATIDVGGGRGGGQWQQ